MKPFCRSLRIPPASPIDEIVHAFAGVDQIQVWKPKARRFPNFGFDENYWSIGDWQAARHATQTVVEVPDEENRGRNMGCHGIGVCDKAVARWLDSTYNEHGLTEYGKTVAPFQGLTVPSALRPQQSKHPVFKLLHQASLALSTENLRLP